MVEKTGGGGSRNGWLIRYWWVSLVTDEAQMKCKRYVMYIWKSCEIKRLHRVFVLMCSVTYHSQYTLWHAIPSRVIGAVCCGHRQPNSYLRSLRGLTRKEKGWWATVMARSLIITPACDATSDHNCGFPTKTMVLLLFASNNQSNSCAIVGTVRCISSHVRSRGIMYYSQTTWAVGIAQLTHHEVQGGGKNPETEGRVIFYLHRGPNGESTAQYRPPMSFCFYPTLCLGNHLYFSKAWQFLKTAKEYTDLGDRQRPLN